MKNLQIINRNGQLLVDSREVAERIDIRHSDILEKIGGSKKVIGYVEVLENGKFRSRDFFIKDSYKSEGNNKTYDCYLLTRKGCDMVANKLTGEKGILFTAEYVTQFEEMENSLKQPQIQLSKELQAIFSLDKRTEDMKQEIKELREDMPLFNVECKELQALVKKVGTKSLGGYKTPAYSDKSLRGRIYADIQQQIKREFGVTRYEAIKRSKLNLAREIVSNYKVPVILTDEIIAANNQIELC